MKYRVLISCKQLQETIDQYRTLFAERRIDIDLPEVVQQMSEADLLKIIDRYDGVIAGDDEITARVIERGVRLKVISKWGVGIDGIDVVHARERGIVVRNTPDVFANEVADVAIGYIVLLARGLHRMDRAVREGNWTKIRGTTLSGKTLGIIGVGSIGRAIAERALAAGMSVQGHDVAPPPEDWLSGTRVRMTDLHALLGSSDFVSLSCNLTDQNRHLLDATAFGLLRRGAYIVNVARGPLIDEAALVDALREGIVAGAALDVFEEEPLGAESPLRDFEECIFGTHNGSNTEEAVARVNEMAIRHLLDALAGAEA